jgi:hypothetical protein
MALNGEPVRRVGLVECDQRSKAADARNEGHAIARVACLRHDDRDVGNAGVAELRLDLDGGARDGQRGHAADNADAVLRVDLVLGVFERPRDHVVMILDAGFEAGDAHRVIRDEFASAVPRDPALDNVAAAFLHRRDVVHGQIRRRRIQHLGRGGDIRGPLEVDVVQARCYLRTSHRQVVAHHLGDSGGNICVRGGLELASGESLSAAADAFDAEDVRRAFLETGDDDVVRVLVGVLLDLLEELAAAVVDADVAHQRHVRTGPVDRGRGRAGIDAHALERRGVLLQGDLDLEAVLRRQFGGVIGHHFLDVVQIDVEDGQLDRGGQALFDAEFIGDLVDDDVDLVVVADEGRDVSEDDLQFLVGPVEVQRVIA